MSTAEIAEPLEQRFEKYRDDWVSKTRHLSNTAQMAMVFSYQHIIGLGPAVVPLILKELQNKTDHWFWALEAITGENPVSKEAAGDMEASAKAWLAWGNENGFVE